MNNINQEDLPYEEDILKNQYSLKSWLRYIDFKNTSSIEIQSSIYERAVKQLPFSYKLWYNYLKLLRNNVKKYKINNIRYENVNNVHERSLNYMHKMPRIWIDYLSFLKFQGFITRFRRTFNRCLTSLPSTQHRRIWEVSLEFINEHCSEVQETTLRMYRRFMELAPEETEDFVEFLIGQKRLDEASLNLVNILNDEHFCSKYNKSKFELWQKLCEIITKNPNSITSLNVDAIVRQGISRYSDQVGLLWTALADYYIRSNNLSHARDIYEEAMNSVNTVADFKLIFSAYDDFNRVIIRRNIGLKDNNLIIDIEQDLAKTEDLLNRRPILLNSVVLKQNPHNVANWLERVSLFENSGPTMQLNTFETALTTIDVTKVTGGELSQVYIKMALLYERHNLIDDARVVFDKAVERAFVKVSDLADIYCARAEMEFRLKNYKEAISILREGVKIPAKHISYHDENMTVADRVHKSLKIWCFLVDLTQAFSTFDNTVHVYDSIIDLHIVTPQIILNYATFLEEKNHFEKAFSVYQKGVSIFRWPAVYDIWLTYLDRFINRFGGNNSERTNELFRSCLGHCPEEHCKEFYLMYAGFVEKYGLFKKALEIYEKAAMSAKKEEKYEMFLLYIEKVRTYCGIPFTRSIYELAMSNLPDNDTKKMGIRFAEMETQLGEIDRARELYGFTAQFCDPRVTEHEFWSKWINFESKFGNQDTIGNYNLVKRSVEAKYNTRQSLINVHLGGVAATGMVSEDSMQNLEANVQKLSQTVSFISGGICGGKDEVEPQNPEAMHVDDDDELEDSVEDMQEQQDDDYDMPEEIPIPDEIYGGLLK